jgi:hypothetical protein
MDMAQVPRQQEEEEEEVAVLPNDISQGARFGPLRWAVWLLRRCRESEHMMAPELPIATETPVAYSGLRDLSRRLGILSQRFAHPTTKKRRLQIRRRKREP